MNISTQLGVKPFDFRQLNIASGSSKRIMFIQLIFHMGSSMSDRTKVGYRVFPRDINTMAHLLAFGSDDREQVKFKPYGIEDNTVPLWFYVVFCSMPHDITWANATVSIVYSRANSNHVWFKMKMLVFIELYSKDTSKLPCFYQCPTNINYKYVYIQIFCLFFCWHTEAEWQIYASVN